MRDLIRARATAVRVLELIRRWDPTDAAVCEAGGCVVRWAEAAGANLCTTFHSPAFVRDRIADGWEIVEHVARGANGNPAHDLVVLRKPWT